MKKLLTLFCLCFLYKGLQADPIGDEFSREPILARLKAKIAAGKPLVAHILVPLCDNENQGIVPVNASLGNGQNLRTNLYWGAGYGIRTHFQRSAEWKQIHTEIPQAEYILERVVFHRKFPNGADVYLIADAYDGAHMEDCLKDYLHSLSGNLAGVINASGKILPINAGADLIAFNGHNGLMDTDVPKAYSHLDHNKDAVAIACYSFAYFEDFLSEAGGYPLVCTTHLLAPEAYVMKAIVETWATLANGEEIRKAAGNAYHKYQKCGIRGAQNLFRSGW